MVSPLSATSSHWERLPSPTENAVGCPAGFTAVMSASAVLGLRYIVLYGVRPPIEDHGDVLALLHCNIWSNVVVTVPPSKSTEDANVAAGLVEPGALVVGNRVTFTALIRYWSNSDAYVGNWATWEALNSMVFTIPVGQAPASNSIDVSRTFCCTERNPVRVLVLRFLYLLDLSQLLPLRS